MPCLLLSLETISLTIGVWIVNRISTGGSFRRRWDELLCPVLCAHTRGRYRYTPVAPCLIVNHLSVTLMNWATVWPKMKFWGLATLVAISFILAFGCLLIEVCQDSKTFMHRLLEVQFCSAEWRRIPRVHCYCSKLCLLGWVVISFLVKFFT